MVPRTMSGQAHRPNSLPSGRVLSLAGSHPPPSGEPEPIAEEDERPPRRHPKIIEMAHRLELGSSSPVEITLGQPTFDDQAMTRF